MLETNTIKNFYDDFSDRQLNTGVNERHKAIIIWLKKFGLKPGLKILEIGCGIGTLTELIAKAVKNKGTISAIDLSEKSIEIAKTRLKRFRNVEFNSTDILENNLSQKYDLVILADVIEHIPLEKHPLLFRILQNVLNINGFIAVNIPDPYCLDYKLKTKKRLQIIDQPVYLDELSKNVIANNLKIDFLKTYAVWMLAGDYQIIRIKHNNPEIYKNTKFKKPKLKYKIRDKLKRTFSQALS